MPRILLVSNIPHWSVGNYAQTLKEAIDLEFQCDIHYILDRGVVDHSFVNLANQYDVIHFASMYTYYNTWKQGLLDQIFKPIIFNYHQTAEWSNEVAQALFERAIVIIVHNETIRQELLNFGIPTNKIRLIHYPLPNLDQFYPQPEKKLSIRKNKGIPDNAFVIGGLGNPTPNKGWIHVAKAFLNALKEEPRLFLYFRFRLDPKIDSRSPYLDEIESTLKGCRRYLIEFGDLSKPTKEVLEEIRGFYNCLDVYCCSSKTEGGAFPPLEASLCGIPLITTKTGMVKDILRHGESVLQYDFGDVEVLTKLLLLASRNPQLMQRLASNALPLVKEAVDIQSNVKLHEALYRELCESNLASIIILTAGRRFVNPKIELDYICNLVKSIEEKTTFPHEIMIVDQGSDENTVNLLKELKVRNLVLKKENIGVAKGRNLGVRLTRGNYLVFLDDDMTVTDGWLTNLVEDAEKDSRIGIIGGKIAKPNGNLEFICGISDKEGRCRAFPLNEPDRGQYDNMLIEVPYVTGGFCLVKRSCIIQLGGFDESYSPFHYEDPDLSFRAHKLGWRVCYTSRSKVIHHSRPDLRTDTFNMTREVGWRKGFELFSSKFKDELSKGWGNLDYWKQKRD